MGGEKSEPLGCSLIALFQCCMFCLLSDWVKWLFLLEYLRVALQLPDNSSDSVPNLNLLDPFTSSPVVMQAALVPVVSQICVSVATIFLPVSSFPASVKKRHVPQPCYSGRPHFSVCLCFLWQALRILFMDLKST